MGRAKFDPNNDQVLLYYGLKCVYGWWDGFNDDQDMVFLLLSGLYGLVSFVALVQLFRIQVRVPEYGWTTQKVFHLLNVLVNGVRCLIFVFHQDVQQLKPEIVQHVLLDVPSLAFFTTYALLVLFWAEIYYQARNVSTDHLRPTFFAINAIIYGIQVKILIQTENSFVVSNLVEAYCSVNHPFQDVLRRCVLVCGPGISCLWGKALFNVETLPCRIKRQAEEVTRGWLCDNNLLCVLPCKMYHGEMCFNAFDEAANLDLMDHPVLNFTYYLLVEILPSSLVLIILRKLPAKRAITPYQLIR
ncbi:tobamovirus multiplication protein 3-like protein [Tanacetum coccineum]|uniref:Tobamovirus multiplication protein 3-like protein n=1 Tax=Tanacetum coccineum TaxID=301880 RepID=A0ABQ5A7L8_9ASTR